MELERDQLIAGRYLLERPLGQGGMGRVWAARDNRTGQAVAVKLVKDPSGADSLAPRFLREAHVVGAARHPHVVEMREVTTTESGVPVLVMELLSGESLRDKLRRLGELPLDECARLLLPVISAVGAAHALGIVHRDLKPENIFLANTDGNGPLVKVLDFGIAKLTALDGSTQKSAGLTSTNVLLGTPCYMAPEQVFGEHDLDHRADIWSLGIMLYECLSGILPTQADNVGQTLKKITTGAIWPLAQAAPDLPKPVTELVDRMLSLDPQDRPSDLAEVRDVLSEYADVARLPDFGPARFSAQPRPEARAPSHRKRSYLVAAGLIALGGIVGAVMAYEKQPTRAPTASVERVQTAPPRATSVPRLPPEPPPPALPDRESQRTVPRSPHTRVAAPAKPTNLPPSKASASALDTWP